MSSITESSSSRTVAKKLSESSSRISVIVAVHASFFEGIILFPSNALMSVDLPELIVAITLIGNTALFILLKALSNLGSLKSSIGPSCSSLNTFTIFSLIKSSFFASEKDNLSFFITPFSLAVLKTSSKSSQSSSMPWKVISKSTVFNSSISILGKSPIHSCNL